MEKDWRGLTTGNHIGAKARRKGFSRHSADMMMFEEAGQGRGILEQIEKVHETTLPTDLTMGKLKNIVEDLKLQKGNRPTEYVVYTGTKGRDTFEKALEEEYLKHGVTPEPKETGYLDDYLL